MSSQGFLWVSFGFPFVLSLLFVGSWVFEGRLQAFIDFVFA